MKYIYLFFTLLLTINLNAQIIFNGNLGQIDTCGPILIYDSGGPNGNYTNSEHFIMTICPTTPNSQIKIDANFMNCSAYDELLFYDGTTINAPYLGAMGGYFINTSVRASATNTSGCVTIEWNSDTLTSANQGFELEVNCQLPCQNFSSELVSSTPAAVPLNNGYIDICPNETVTFSGQGNYFENNILYAQADSTSTFKWLINGTAYTGQTATHTFPNSGGYKVQLEITDAQGCKNTNLLNQRVRVAPPPLFTGTNAIQNAICIGDTLTLQGNVVQQTKDFTSGVFSADTLQIVNPVSNSTTLQSSSIIVDGFFPGQTLNDTTELLKICAKLQHHGSRWLDMKLTCPSGQSMYLHKEWINYSGPGWGTLGETLGGSSLMHVGYDYCWTPTTTYMNLADAAVVHQLFSGTYGAEDSFTNLLGCELNGEWTLEFINYDGWGWLYNWSIDFADSLYVNNETFTPQTVNKQWLSDSTIISSVGDSIITVVPTQAGTAAYTFTTTNDYGCSYDTTVTITVQPLTDGVCKDCDVAFSVPNLQDTTICAGESVAVDATVLDNFNRTYTYAASGQPIRTGDTVRAMIEVANVTPNPFNTNALESVCLDIDHNNPEDLDIYLIAPNGLKIELSTDNGVGVPNAYQNTCFSPTATTNITAVTAPYTAIYQPEQNFSIINLSGPNPNGMWTLEIRDDANFLSDGVLKSWSINFTNQSNMQYVWASNPDLSCTYCPDPVITPTTTSNYIVFLQGYGCLKRDTITITVFDTLAAPTIICDSISQTAINFTWSAIPNAVSYEVNVNNTGWQPSNDSLGHWVTGLSPNQAVNIEVRGVQNECTFPSGIGTATCTTLPCDVVSNSTIQHVTCPSGNDGNMTISATSTNTITQYIYHTATVSDSNNTGIFNNLIANNYQIIVQDAIGCSDTITVILTEPNPITPNETIINNVWFGENNGSIILNPTGGTAPFTYLWSDNSTDSLLTNLASGNYSVTITDSESCILTQTFDILPLQPLTSNLTTTTQTNCGVSDATITTSITGGLQPYTFLWNDGNTSQNRMGLDTGMYIVTITDALGCMITDTVFITPIHAPITFIDASYAIVNCTDIDSNKIVICAYGDAALEYSIDGGTTWQSSNIFSGLPIGTYQVRLRYIDGTCIISGGDYTIGDSLNDFTMPTQGFGLSYVTPVSCKDGSDGEIHLDIPTCSAFFNNGYNISDYQVYWSDNGSSDSVRTGLTAGSYHLTFTQPYTLATTSCSFTVPEPDSISTTLTTTLVTDCNGNDGTATVSLTGGTPNYTYQWNNNDNTSIANNLTSGTAIVTVTDANNCIKIDSITVSEPEPITFNTNQTNLICHTNNLNGTPLGTITINVLSGTTYPSYEYSIDCGLTWQASNTFINLPVGNYDATVRYTNGTCQTACQPVAITQPDSLNLSFTTSQVTCYGLSDGTATVSVVGGNGNFSYLWDNNNQNTATATNLPGGFFEVTVTDGNTCQTSDTVFVFAPVLVNIDAISSTPTLCFGSNEGTISATASGGTGAKNYTWTDSLNQNFTGQNITNLYAGMYHLTAADQQGCIAQDSVRVLQPDSLAATFTVDSLDCFDDNSGWASVNVLGGTQSYSFIWNLPFGNNSNTNQANNLASAFAIVTVTDANNCVLIDSVFVPQPLPLSLNMTAIQVSCFGGNDGTATVSASGGSGTYNYLWSNNSQNNFINNLSGGMVYVTVSDANNCTTNDSIEILENPILTVSETIQNVNCFGDNDGQIHLSPSGGTGIYNFQWQNSTVTDSILNQLSIGIYTYTVTDSDGCNYSDTVEITEPQPLSLSLISTNPTCLGGANGTATATVLGGTLPYNYTWSRQSQNAATVQNLTGGWISVTVTDANNCTITDSIFVQQPDPISIITTSTPTTCTGGNDGTATAIVSGGLGNYTYVWINATGQNLNQNLATAINLSNGQYFVAVTDTNNCTVIDSVFVGEPQPLEIIPTFTPISCFGENDGSITLSIENINNYTFLWENGETSSIISNLESGNYIVTITDSLNCIFRDTIFINQPTEITPNFEVEQITCFGENDGQIQINPTGGTPNYRYNFNENGFTSSNRFVGLQAGNYQIVTQDGNGCEVTDTIEIIEPQPIEVDLGEDILTEVGNQIVVNATVTNGTAPFTYIWNPADSSLSCADCLTPVITATEAYKRYDFIVTDANGCLGEDFIIIRTNKERTIFVANAFTPNDDGNNDVLFVQGVGRFESVRPLTFRVFNRWGELVFETIDAPINDENYGWNGTFKNQKVSGHFVWVAMLTFENGTEEVLKGSVLLIR